MSKNKQELENRCEAFDEIIKMSVEMEAEDAQILSKKDIEEMGLPLPPPDMYDRIMKECNKHESRSSNKRKITRRIILVAAVLSVLVFGALSAQAVKVYVFNLTHKVSDNTIRFTGEDENVYTFDASEDDSYKTAEEKLGVPVLKPEFIPLGFKFEAVRTYEQDHVFMIYKNQDSTIKVTQTLINDPYAMGEIMDTEKEEAKNNTYIFNEQNRKISIGEYTQEETGIKWHYAVWKDDKLMYRVEANCAKDDFEKFVLGLK